MFFFINRILGTLIAGILYPLLITAPLQILNGIYQAFQICCGASIGQMFFNQSQGHLVIDVNAPIFRFIIRTLIICLILMVCMIIVLSIEHLVTKKKINLLSKIKWPIIAVTSTVTIPLAFMLLSSLSVAFMSLVGGTTVQIYLLSANVTDMVTTMSRAVTQLGENFNIKLKDISGAEFNVDLITAIEQLRNSIITISQEATKSGLQDVVDKCRLTANYLEQMVSILRNWDANIIKPMNDVMNYISNSANWTGDHVKFSSDMTSKLKSVITTLNNFQTDWSNSVNGITDILKDASIFCKEALSKELEIVSGHKITIQNLLSTVDSKWTGTWGQLNNLWIDADKDNLSLWTCMLNGGTWKNVDGSVQILFDTDKHQTSLNMLNSCIDPQTNNTYNLVIQIYQLVTGNKDTNWTGVWNMSKPLSLINVGVGFVIIVGACFVTGLFGLMAARRLIELAVLGISSIVFATIGIRDDGAKFTNCVKLIVTKMFSIVIAYASFTIGVALLQTVSSWVTTHAGTIGTESFAFGVIQSIVLIGGLLGAYHIAILLQQWMGDSTSIQGTLADMGALGAMGSAAKFAGGAIVATKALAKGAGAISNAAKAQKQANIWKMAESKGLGSVQYTFNSKGQLKASGFKLNTNLDNASGKFDALMKNKKEFKLWKQDNKDKAKFQKGQELLAKGKTEKGNKVLDKLQNRQMEEVWKNLEKKGK